MKSNKVMLITGATSGVGKALAEHYYKKNYKLILVGGSKEKVDKQSKKFKKNTLFICADLTKSKDVKRIVRESITKFKKIDILIANAGLYEPDKIISGNPDRWDRVISVNVTSVFRLVNLVLPYMKKNKFGDIAITSSISGHQAIHWEPIYSASKHAIQSFAHGLRTQVSKNNIRVISIAPGMIMTELWDLDPIKNKKYIKDMINKGNALDVKEVVSCFDFALSRGRGANIRDLVILPTNQNL
jgi:ribitol 2-dehydrogenase